MRFSLSKIEVIDVDKMHPFKIFQKLSQNNFTNLKDTFCSQITTLLKRTRKGHMTIYFFHIKINYIPYKYYLLLLFYMECNLFLSVTFVCAKKKTHKKATKAHKKPPKCAPSHPFTIRWANFLSLEISNFGPFLFFSFLLTALHNDYKRNEDTGKMAYSCSTKLQSFHDLSPLRML